MNYEEAIEYIHSVKWRGSRPGLERITELTNMLGNPEDSLRFIHVAGTNGKGSICAMLSSILSAAGYRVGLFTSPFVEKFNERIMYCGENISNEDLAAETEYVKQFADKMADPPTEFELITAIALSYYKRKNADYVVFECGLGGRLDSTNVIKTPVLSVITGIDLDHTAILGNTTAEIAAEKAGIIKEDIPVIVGKVSGAVKRVFTMKAKAMNACIVFAEELKSCTNVRYAPYDTLKESRAELQELLEEEIKLQQIQELPMKMMQFVSLINPTDAIHAIDRIIDKRKDAILIHNSSFMTGLYYELSGLCQTENCLTILAALEILKNRGYEISKKDYHTGFSDVCEMTGLMGRWQKLQSYPDVICDTGHNADGFKCIRQQLNYIHNKLNQELHIVFGMVNDKDISSVLELLPKDATYYFTKASVKRALPEDELMKMASEAGLKGPSYPTVADAVRAAKENCPPKDFIFVGGSNFIVADLLANRDTLNLY